MPFEPDAIRVACGHFIGGRPAPAADALAVHTGGYRQSGIGNDLGRQAVANLGRKSALIDVGAAPSAEAVSAWAAFHAVSGHANESFGAAGAANRHKLARRAC
jgi:hypothetical protein